MAQDQPNDYVCFRCYDAKCSQCVDVMAVVMGTETECNCQRPGHDGEPINNQVTDPFTGAVHAPGLVVEQSGEVIHKWQRHFPTS